MNTFLIGFKKNTLEAPIMAVENSCSFQLMLKDIFACLTWVLYEVLKIPTGASTSSPTYLLHFGSPCRDRLCAMHEV